jgi:hypothetical protein
MDQVRERLKAGFPTWGVSGFAPSWKKCAGITTADPSASSCPSWALESQGVGRDPRLDVVVDPHGIQ